MSSIATYLSGVFESSQFADITIKTANGKKFKASKLILSRSPVFNAMLNRHDTKEAQEGIIEVTDVSHEVMTEMIRFMYTDETPKMREMALDLMIVANKYDLPKLFEKCKIYLKNHIKIETLTDVLVCADGLSIKDLEDTILQFISKNDDAVFSSNEWKIMKEINSEIALKVMEYCYRELKNKKGIEEPKPRVVSTKRLVRNADGTYGIVWK